MILLQKIVVVRVAGELYQADSNPNHWGDGSGESNTRMILKHIKRKRVVMRVKSG